MAQTTIARRGGLTTAEARARLGHDGPNVLPSDGPRPLLPNLLDVLREPMLLLLVATGGIYLVLGDPFEAVAMAGAIALVVVISLVQARRTERTLHALRTLSSPRAQVMRDRVAVHIAGADVVRGDALLLNEGDRIAADGILGECVGFSVDESMLTGESASVAKAEGEQVYSGTLVVSGNGLAEVTRTGAETELGRIGRSLSTLHTGRTPLQVEVGRAVNILATLGLLACLAVVFLYGLRDGTWGTGILAGLTMAMSMVPEEFPVILTVFLAIGAWRLSQRQVLTRRFPAIEALGSATTLCVDKTGTLTLNRMSIAGLDVHGTWRATADREPAGAERELLEWAALASPPRAVDPMDLACRRAGPPADDSKSWTLEREYPLARGRLFSAQGWRDGSQRKVIAAKGAPESIAALCGMDTGATTLFLTRVTSMAEAGLRVLAVARATVDGEWPGEPEAVTFGCVGLIGFSDPVRPTVPAAVRDCRTAGVRVVMLTGDYPPTARSVARAAGLDLSDGVLTGADVTSMNDRQLGSAVRRVNVFARVRPEQKLRLVRALQAGGDVVAMTGDGVNDAPALKAADIGIAMGLRGTDVAREAAALVLLDDDFASIVGAVRLGRRIYDNIRRATAYVLAVHVPIAGLSLIPPMLGWPLVLLPLHIVFMELIVDPASSIAFEMEPEEAQAMQRPPRPRTARLFDARLVTRSLVHGTGMLAVVLTVNAAAVLRGLGDADVRMLTFATLILSNLALILTNRSRANGGEIERVPNPAFPIIVIATLVALTAVLLVPSLRDTFRLAQPHLTDGLICLVAVGAAAGWMELTARSWSAVRLS